MASDMSFGTFSKYNNEYSELQVILSQCHYRQERIYNLIKLHHVYTMYYCWILDTYGVMGIF